MTGHARSQSRPSRDWRHPPKGLAGAGLAVYVLAYLLTTPLLGATVAVLAAPLVVLVALSRGRWMGALAGLATLPVNLVLGSLVPGPSGNLWLEPAGIATAGAMALVGFATAWVRDGSPIEVDARLERALESEANWRGLLDGLGEAVAIVSDGKWVYVNGMTAEWMGYSRAEMIGRSVYDFSDTANSERIAARIADLERGGDVYASEYEILRADGSSLPIEALAKRVEFEGRPALLSISRDITRRREREAALREAESKYRTLVEQSLVGVYVYQDDGLVYVNPKLAEILGYPATDLLSRGAIDDLIIEDDRHIAREARSRRLRGETAVTFSMRLRRQDGSLTHVEVRAGTTTFLGRPAFIGSVLDETARRRAEAALRTSEEQFRTVFEQGGFGMALLDLEFRMVRANGALCGMLGYSGAELSGMSLAGLEASGEDHPWAEHVLDNVASAYQDQRRLRTKRGTVVVVEVTLSVVRDHEEAPTYVIAMIADMTRQKRIEQQLRQAQQLEAIGLLAGGVAHNINNALTAIAGYTEMTLRQPDLPDRSQRYARKALDVTKRSAGLTAQLLAFSRGKAPAAERFDLRAAVEAAQNELEPLLGDAVTLVARFHPALCPVSANRSDIEQVIMNLVLNARDAMPHGGTVTVETNTLEAPNDLADASILMPAIYVALVVRDSGVGMTPQAAAEVFQPFFTTKADSGGVGLGLAMAHGAVKQSGGHIHVESDVGRGTTFTVYLPFAD